MDLENKNWDEAIQKMFTDYKPADSTPDWNHMHTIIQHAEADHHFDKEIKASLSNIMLPYEEASWQNFQIRRQAGIQRRNHIITARAVETLILFLLIWTSNRLIIPSILESKNHSVEVPTDKAFANSSSQETESIALLPIPNKSNLISSASDNSKKEKNSSSNTQQQTFNTKSIQENSKTSYTKDFAKVGEERSSSIALAQLSESMNEDAAIHLVPDDKVEQKAKVDDLLSNSTLNTTQVQVLDILESKEIPVGISLSQMPALKITPSPKQGATTWISLYGGVLLNQVASAPLTYVLDPEFLQGKTQSQIGPNCTGGIMLEFRHNPWSIQSGLQYIRYEYDPGLHEIYTNQEDQTIRKNFTQIKYQTLSIPVLLQRRIISNGKFSIHIKSGLSVTASLKNEYTISIEVQKPTAGLTSVIPTIETRSQFEQLNLQKGILQQGNFGQNAFVNFVAGTKLSYRIRNGLEYFAEANYNKMLGKFGFGPRGDSFQGISINVGTSIKL